MDGVAIASLLCKIAPGVGRTATGVENVDEAPREASGAPGEFCCTSASAQAQMSYPAEAWWDNRWYVAPYVQFTFSDTARLAKDGTGFGLAVGKAFAPSWDLELRGAYEELPKQGAPDNWHNWTAEVDGKWYFLGREGVARWDGLQPYGIAGIGLIYDSVGVSKTSFMASVGLGVALPLARWGRFFIDGRYRWDGNSGTLVSQNSFGDFVLNVGVVIPFGAAPAVTEPAAVKPPPAPQPPPPPHLRRRQPSRPRWRHRHRRRPWPHRSR